MLWLGQWPWQVVLGLISFLLLLFPSGHLVSPRWRPVAWIAGAATACLWLWAAFEPRELEGVGLEGLANPLAIHGAEVVFTVIGAAASAIFPVTILAAASMVVRFRRARGEERQQLKWFTYAAALSVLVWLVFIVTDVANRLPVFRDGQVGDGSGVAAGDLSRVSGRVGRAHGRDRAWTRWCPRSESWPWAPGSGRGGGVG
jgi:hypothetical protein